MTFYFFDVETSGFKPRADRIMQFAGQRTDMDFKPIGPPDNLLIKLSSDVLPQPDAILITGITPQATLAGGISEAAFCKYLTSQVSTDDTILVGYNNLRFDNEFIRFSLWRNFYDPYEWSWKNGCSTWDLLDVGRMTRALRPEGIKWPYASDGRPSNKLELLASINKLDHSAAHDALSDVMASIGFARLLKTSQPKLFDYLLNLRNKNKVAVLVGKGQPLVYTSGRYLGDWQKTTVAAMVIQNPKRASALMYDLRIDPEPFADMAPTELASRWAARGEDAAYFPVKELSYNRCPALAPLSVMDKASQKRLGLRLELIENHSKKLKSLNNFGNKLLEALEIKRSAYQPQLVVDDLSVDGALYDGFIQDVDKPKMSAVNAANPSDLPSLDPKFKDQRLKLLFPLFKARNFPESLNAEEKRWWQDYRRRKLLAGGSLSPAAVFEKRLQEIAATPGLTKEHQYLVNELEAYSLSILPKA
ncbi:MAG: exodeoxyribonuclease I [Candidatus Saccharimonadales bacterium]